MNRIFFICIASALLFTGCNSNSQKETESSSEMIPTVATENATENSLEETENTIEMKVTSETITTVVDIDDGTEIIVTESTEKQSQTSDFSNDTAQKELPVMNEENQESEMEVTTSVRENSKETITTTIVENTESASTSTAVYDDVIELPFVPVR